MSAARAVGIARWRTVLWSAFVALLAATSPAAAAGSFTSFETEPVRPVALAAAGDRLFVTNIPDDHLEIFAVTEEGLRHSESVPVGSRPVAVAVRWPTEVWVVNHLSDSVSIVDVGTQPARVIRTLLVGDEPRDIVFAGPNRDRAFITTAHRGQNSPVDPQLSTPGVGRADVWVFDATQLGTALGGEPLTVLSLFGDTPRALAVSPEGETVYAAVFKSGNQTTVVNAIAVCDGGEAAPPCVIQGRQMPGGLPAPNASADGVTQPETGLIVKYDAAIGVWKDGLGRSWNNAVPISLPDMDVFAIDANADPPVLKKSISGVGTVLYNMAVNPVSGHVYVTNTEARNEVRFEPNVQGHIHESRITVIDQNGATPRHLNKHIDYDLVPSPAGVVERSLALPLQMAVSADGTRLFVAAYGSDAIGVFDTGELEEDTFVPSASDHIAVEGGPCGVALDEIRQRLYVPTRFDNAVAVINLETRHEIARSALHTPEPASLVRGRRFLYDARYTSSNGEVACASCHVFAGADNLAWDLGDPDGFVVANPNPRNELISEVPIFELFEDFHPLKGPMTTQTLRGLADNGPMHWRGDRTGGLEPNGDPFDERAAFKQFNPAFRTLMGREAPLPDKEMDWLADFVLQIIPPPNPIRPLDNALTPAQAAARTEFFGDDDGACLNCHALEPSAGLFGSDLTTTTNGQSAQLMKVPDLRQAYQKVGMFGLFPQLSGFLPSGSGDQVRGFGFINDGSAGVFVTRAFDYAMAFDSNLAPIVGQQVTLTAAAGDATHRRVDLLIERAEAGECDVVAKAVVGGEPRGWTMMPGGLFRGDRAADVPLSDAGLRNIVGIETEAITYTCVPPGSGVRVGVDRDADATFDGDEVVLGTDPLDPEDPPGTSACAGGALGRRFQLRILRNAQAAGSQRFGLAGDFDVAAQDPPLDPSAYGFRVAIGAADGRELFYRIIPPGAASAGFGAAVRRGQPGWHVLGGNMWSFRDESGSLANGITRAVVRGPAPGAAGSMRFRIRGENADFRVDPTDLPLSIVVQVGGPAQGRAGQCGLRSGSVGASNARCRVSRSGDSVLCR